jgi:DNA-directed RNA polymerase specialized sigma24 family protein
VVVAAAADRGERGNRQCLPMPAVATSSTVSTMDVTSNADEPLLPQLPLAYAVALRMHASGATVGDIAAALGVDVASVGSLIDVGRRKLLELGDGAD